ncbi:glycosyl transferase [Streptococcus pyogenes]|nr:glycosyl transferase [Streptococcus pyogenes]
MAYCATNRKKKTDATSGLRLIDRSLIERFANHYPDDYPEPETVVDVLVSHFKVKEIPVVMNERQGGVSSISLTKSVYYMIKVTLAILVVRLKGNR